MFDRQPSTGGKSGAKHGSAKPQYGSAKQSSAKATGPSARAVHRGTALQNAFGNRGTLSMLQTKLKTGRPNDPYEQEADQVADLVMRKPRPGAELGVADVDGSASNGSSASRTAAPVIQRKCSTCEDERREEMISGKSAGGLPGTVSEDLESRIETVRTGGEPLSREVRSDLEPRFGRDFGHVRVHTDTAAASTADELQAHAYTIGRDIVFASGQYAPQSERGQRLLAHELTHVVQQTDTPTRAAAGKATVADGKAPTAKSAAPSVARSPAGPQIQGAWHLSGMRPTSVGSNARGGNGGSLSFSGHGFAYASATAWQEAGFWQIYGGWARANQLGATQYTFEHDGADDDFLELTTIASITGQAKAEDLIYAQGAGAVAGIIKVRTHADPTPAGTQMFTPISEGGRSTASSDPVADLDVTIPIDGSVSLNIPLNATSEGEMAPIEDMLTPPDTQDIRGVLGEPRTVDVYLGAYSNVAADIETAVWDVAGDENYATVISLYNLTWRTRSIPAAPGGGGGPGSPGGGGSSEGDRGDPESDPSREPDEASTADDKFKGSCYSGRNCDGKVLQRRVLHCHNCKKHVSGRSILRPDGSCETC